MKRLVRLDPDYASINNQPQRKPWANITDYRPAIHFRNDMTVTGMNLVEDWTVEIKHALVIGNGHTLKARWSARLLGLEVTELESHELTTTLPPDYRDRVEIKNMVLPIGYQCAHHGVWQDQVRNMNHRLEYREVCRIFDHMSAWHHIITQATGPAIVLEDDVTLKQALPVHLPRNSIIGLDTGGKLHVHNTNYRVMPGVWAYSIDHSAARRMFNRVMEQGIREPLELMFRADQQLIVLGDVATRSL